MVPLSKRFGTGPVLFFWKNWKIWVFQDFDETVFFTDRPRSDQKVVSYYLGPTEHEYTKKKFFSPRLKFRKNSVYHAS